MADKVSQEETDNIAAKYQELKKRVEQTALAQDVREFRRHQELFIKKFAYLVHRNTYKYKKFSNYSDLQQVGFQALLASLKTYKKGKGAFTWWAEKYIKTRISRAANAHSAIRYPIKKAKEMKPYKTSCIPVMIDDSADPFESVEDQEVKERVLNAIKTLPTEHQVIVNLTYGTSGARAKPMTHLIKDMDISRTQYLKLLREAKEHIKKQLISYD